MKALHKVIITGTGRAGTTFLVRLLTELGLDTGYTPEAAWAGVDGHSQAGLEHSLLVPRSRPTARDWLRQPKHTIRDLLVEPAPGPYIIKNPAVCDTLEAALADKRLIVDHVYIPVRNLEEAALSRARVGGGHGSVAGGLWKTDDPHDQKAVLAEMFFNLVHTLTRHDLPHTFLLFPRLVEDWAYTYHKLWFLVKDTGAEQFRQAFERVADRKLVHHFGAGGPAASNPQEARAPNGPPPAGSGRKRRLPGAGGLWSAFGLAAWRSQGVVRLASWAAMLGVLGFNMRDRLVPSAVAAHGPQASPAMHAPALPPSPSAARPMAPGRIVPEYPMYRRCHHWRRAFGFEPWRTWRHRLPPGWYDSGVI